MDHQSDQFSPAKRKNKNKHVSWFFLTFKIVSCVYRHVWFTASVDCLRYRVDKISTDAKVAHFDLTASIDQDIRRFDIAMDHLQIGVEVMQRADDRKRDFTQNILWYPQSVIVHFLIKFIQASIHYLRIRNKTVL